MPRKLTHILLFLLLALLAACGSDSGGGNDSINIDYLDQTGTLVVNIDYARTRYIMSGTDMEPAMFNITGYGPNNSTFSRPITAEEPTATVEHLLFGDWHIYAEALNDSNVSIGGGDVTVTIHTGETTACEITVSPFEGTGILALTIDWDPDVVDNPYLTATISRTGYDPVELNCALDASGTFAEITEEIDTGYYILRIDLYDGTDSFSPYIGGAVEVVRIIENQTTSATITIHNTGTDDNNPDIGDLDNPGFPSPGSPEGSDAISASTNHSGRENETSPRLNPLAGAAFVNPPQINNYGTMNLSYTVDVPAGRAGMQPAVGLSYSSSGGDGLVGIGWNLGTGLGVISRTTRHGQLYYDFRDTFTYNGKRLVKTDGPEESEKGIYRLEIESGFSRFELTDTEDGGIWKVYDKSGTVTVFGEERSGRIYRPDDEDKTYIWNFSRSYDLNGNCMYAVYDTSEYEDNHILYLKEIRYTGNYEAGTPARQYVRFTYKDRSDSYVSTAPGFIMNMDRLLDRITVGWDDPSGGVWGGSNTELWTYEMVYETSEDSGRPLLRTVNSSRNTTQPVFRYQEAEHYFTWRLISNPDYSKDIDPAAVKYFEGDFNGDGLSDMVFFNPATGDWRSAQATRQGGYEFITYGNRFQGYDTEQKIQFFKGNVTGDYNGDGRSDIAFYLPGTKEFWVAEHTGTVFNFRCYGKMYLTNVDIFKCEWFTGDYDGNGLSDAVLFDETTGEWTLMRNMGGSFSFIKFSQHFKNLFRDDYYPDSNMDSGYTSDDSEYGRARGKVHFLSGDYNGDGRTDISIYDERDGKWWVAENYRADDIGFRLSWKLYKVFTAPEQALFGNDRFSGDFNGDGLSDFLLFDRGEGEWILGETKNYTINFRRFSRTPQFKEITRWLQGDFNGDGRTDIGFFSATDNNFWIGEATPTGFRYRIYNNLSYGPDPDEVLKKAPLPYDDVKIETGEAGISSTDNTYLTEYKYDGNYYTDRGEKVFTGCFTTLPGMIIYRRSYVNDSLKDGWYYQEGSTGTTQPVKVSIDAIDIDPETENVRILNNGSAFRYADGKDGILYYNLTSSGHAFSLLRNNGAWENLPPIGNFSEGSIPDFTIDEGLYLVDDFNDDNVDEKKSVLVLKQGAAGGMPGQEASVFLLDSDDNESIEIGYDDSTTLEDFRLIFDEYKDNRSNLHFFSGRFTAGPTESAQILIADTRAEEHRWYLGTLDLDSLKIYFTELTNTDGYRFESDGYSGIYTVNNGELIYSTNDGEVRFHKITINSYNEINTYTFDALNSGITFKGEFDHNGNPIVYSESGIQYYSLIDSEVKPYTVGQGGIQEAKIERPDLIENFYPFQWIQGDYNGDGKTDIGIFHLGEPTWYFADTVGTVPDLLYRVDNGIGGTYAVTYINSTSLDNTGEDNIPDLPMNYKVCDSLTVEDGTGNRVVTKYEYKDGYAFSGFINGYKETDYFGFGEFRVIDALGSRSTSRYYNVPFEDYRMNRALAGAIRESSFTGWDSRVYNRTTYQYKLHQISESSEQKPSFLVEPVKVVKYARDHGSGSLVQFSTTESNIVLAAGEYEMLSKTETMTDHYADAAHPSESISTYYEYENLRNTNEMRLAEKRSFDGTDHETTAAYDYDSNGNLIRETLAYTGGAPGMGAADRVMEYEYDDYGNRIRETNTSDDPHRVVNRSYEDESRLYQFLTREWSTVNGIEISTSYSINYGKAFGSVKTVTDANGSSTFFDYDDYARLFRQRADTEYGDRRILSEYVYGTDFPLSAKVIQYTGTTDDEIETRVFADGTGRTIHSVRSATAAGASGMRYVKTGKLVYDPAGRLIRKSQTAWAGDNEIDTYRANSAEKNPTRYEYDASGRQKKITLPQAYAGEPETSTAFTYNDPWEVVSEQSIGRTKRTIQNARGLTLYVEDSGPSTGSGTGAYVRAAIGFAYDIAGNRVKKMDLSASSPLNPPEGDLSGFIAAVDNSLFYPGVKDTSGSNIAQWKYDGFGQVTASSDPDMGYTGLEYNGFGDVTARTDALGMETQMHYDPLGRITGKELPGEEGAVYYTYDSAPGCHNVLGRLAAINDPAQIKVFSYDRMGRINRETRSIKTPGGVVVSGGTFVTSFEYDLLNRKRIINYPADPRSGTGLTARYSFGSMGVTSVEAYNNAGRKEIISNIQYNEFGQMTRVVRGNNTVTNYTYDIKGRLSNLETLTNNNDMTRQLQDVRYTFRTDNSIASITNSPDMDTVGSFSNIITYNYEYDGLNRLIKAEGIYSKSSEINSSSMSVINSYERGYSYAPNGNILSRDIYDPESHSVTGQRTYNYDDNNHAVTDITESGTTRVQMQYDAAGNMTLQRDNDKNIAKAMIYDSYNRITKVTNPDNSNELTGQYWYDDQGFRVRKVANRKVGNEQRMVEVLYPSMYFGVEKHRTPSGQLIEDTTYAVNNIYLDGVRIAAVIPSGQARYYLTDQVDSVKVVVDDTGNAVSRMEYLPFGETWFQEGDENNSPKYNSQELDKETGYYFYNARHYDGDIARFVTPDSVIPRDFDTQSWNRFAYCVNNPIEYKDPTGHYELKVDVTKDRDHAGTLTLYNDYGVPVASYSALARGSNQTEIDTTTGEKKIKYAHTERTEQGTDTPTGKYEITGKYKIEETSTDYSTFGPGGFNLKGVEGEAGKLYKELKRSNIGAHGGDELPSARTGIDPSEKGSTLKYTKGCIRLSNEDMADILSKTDKMEEDRKSGFSGFLYKVRNSLYNAIGKDTRDTLSVIETDK